MAVGFDQNGGPPKGSSSDSAYAQQIPADALIRKGIGPEVTPADDPGFPKPYDPVKVPGTEARAKLVYRDLPLVTIQNAWTVNQVRSALRSHMIGIFENSGQLVDSMLGDDRVMATLGSRISGLFGREVRFRPADDSAAAREVLDAWVRLWPSIISDGSLVQCHAYAIFMGWNPAQLLWDTSGPVWCPYLRPWHPRFTYYNWPLRRYVALSLDGQLPIMPGDGKWVLHAPYGEYRGWVRGAVRPVSEPWLFRHFAFRDWARFSEVHGMPTRVGKVPAASDPGERSQFENSLANLGNDTSMILPLGVDEHNSYGYELVEATDRAWEAFPGLIDRADMAIVLSLLFQNLTTEVKGGSFAATTAHMDIRQSGIQADNSAWRMTIYNQIARPFAYLNFGDASLAPWTDWDVKPREDYEHLAKQFQQFGTAVEVLRRGGVQFKDADELRRFAKEKFDLDGLPGLEFKDPVGGGAGGGGGGFGAGGDK